MLDEVFDASKYDFPVSKQAIKLADGTLIPEDQAMHLVNDRTKQPICATTKSYPLFHVGTMISPLGKAIKERFGTKNIITKTKNIGDCYFEFVAEFPDHEYVIDGRGIMRPTFRFRTSYNRKFRNNGMVGDWNSACWNTQVSGFKFAHVYAKHSKGFDPKFFVSKVEKALDMMGQNESEYRKLYDTPVSRLDVIDLFENTVCKYENYATGDRKVNEGLLSTLMRKWDEEARHVHGMGAYGPEKTRKGSMWNTYNALTWWSTHYTDGRQRKTKPANPFGTLDIREQKVVKCMNSQYWRELV